MKNSFRKYLVPSLAVLLILSNFSFATNLMLCNMKDNDSACMCKHKVEKKFTGLSISKVKNSCCSNETVILSNSNTLDNVKTEKCCNPLIVLHYINSEVLNNNKLFTLQPGFTLPDQIPKTDIPIITSSLLI